MPDPKQALDVPLTHWRLCATQQSDPVHVMPVPKQPLDVPGTHCLPAEPDDPDDPDEELLELEDEDAPEPHIVCFVCALHASLSPPHLPSTQAAARNESPFPQPQHVGLQSA